MWLDVTGEISPHLIIFYPLTVEKSFQASKLVYTASYDIFIAKSTPRLAPEWSLILVKISHLKMNFVMCLASERLFLSFALIYALYRYEQGFQVFGQYLWVDRDHAFPDRHLLLLGIRLGYLTVVSRVPCARVLRCVTRYEGGDSSIIGSISSNDRNEVRLLNSIIQHHMAYLLQNLPPD